MVVLTTLTLLCERVIQPRNNEGSGLLNTELKQASS